VESEQFSQLRLQGLSLRSSKISFIIILDIEN
jgi:hypothetical protein